MRYRFEWKLFATNYNNKRHSLDLNLYDVFSLPVYDRFSLKITVRGSLIILTMSNCQVMHNNYDSSNIY